MSSPADNKSLDASGGSASRNLLGGAKGALIRDETFLALLILAVVGLTIAVCCLLVLTAKFYWQKRTTLRDATLQFEQWKYQSETSIRNDAIQRSQSVIIGKVTEHLIPYLP